MPSVLPQYIEPKRLAAAGDVLTGKIDQVEMPRLTSLVSSSDSEVSFSLVFCEGAQGEIQITGNLKTTLTMQCQRCLSEMKFILDNPISISVIKNGNEVELINSDFEPILVNEEKIILLDLIEDEVILGLPIAPLHSQDACSVKGQSNHHFVKKENPFAELSKLKSSKT